MSDSTSGRTNNQVMFFKKGKSPTTSTIGGTTKGRIEIRSITGRSPGRRRWTQNTVGTMSTRLTATVSREIWIESQNEDLNMGSSNTVRYQWNGFWPGWTPARLNCTIE